MNFENHDEQGKRIKFIDSRFYTKDEQSWYPGVTTILGVVDRGEQYKKWLQSNGFNADVLGKQAMEQGSHVHEAIQDFLLGREIRWATDKGDRLYTRNEWILISRFIDFYTAFKPQTLEVEKILVSDKLCYGSQIDYACMLNGERWLIDHKTGNFYDSSNMQLAALGQLWDEYFPQEKIQRYGIMHLESTHRGRDSKGKSIQGKGWKLIECENVDKEWEDFKHVHAIWRRKNPDFKPFTFSYPDRYSIDSVTTVELPD
jgi:hypothetical protein